MDIDHFNRRIIEIQEKLFDAEMLITRMAVDLLDVSGGKIHLNIEFPYCTSSSTYLTFNAEMLFFNEDTGAINLADSKGEFAVWDSIDVQSKEMIVNEALMKLTSDQLYAKLAAKDEIH